MALISRNDGSFSKRLDKESGAIYSVAKNDKSFHSLLVKRVDRLGQGSFGTVNLVQSTISHKVFFAAKTILFSRNARRNECLMKSFLRETAVLQSLDHKNIVKLIFSGVRREFGLLLITYCNEGSLHVENLSDFQVLKYFINILDAVQHMHSRRIVHRDIKLDNILVKNDDVFLTDFNHSEKLPEDSNSVSGGSTPQYHAPEVYDASCTAVFDGLKADAYSVGVVLYCLLMREEPPNEGGVFDLWPILQDSEKFDSMDPTLRHCARQLLENNPDERADVTLLYHTLGHNGYVPDY